MNMHTIPLLNQNSAQPGLQILEVGLVQLSETRVSHPYLPYTIGLLQAYALKHARHPERLRFRPALFQQLKLAQALELLKGVQVAAFSVYCWNIRRSLAIAQELKRQQPETLIIFGGPQVPQQQSEDFLREHPWIDVVALGEGERSFLGLLEDPLAQNWHQVPGIAWIDQQHQFQSTPRASRINELTEIPSPYLSGVFEPLLKQYPEIHWVATWETNRGCPFQCSFCDWGGLIQSRVYQFELQRLLDEIEWFGQNGIADIFCADANFGMLERDLELAQQMVACKQRYGAPHLFQTQMAKNVKLRNLEIQKLLAESGLNPVAAISLQSLHPETLKAIRRQNISSGRFQEVQAYCQRNGIFNYTDLIIGLPGESYDSFADGISQVIAQGQHNRIMFFNAAILPNAEMGSAEYRAQHQLQSVLTPFPGQAAAQEVAESLEIIIASRTMSADDWLRMQVLAWSTNLFYYLHKPLQLLMLVMHQLTGLSFRQMLEPLCQAPRLRHYPLLQEIRQRLQHSAEQLQAGKLFYYQTPELEQLPEGTLMSPEVILQLKMVQQKFWPALFQEAGHLLLRQALSSSPQLEISVFQEALKLSEAHFYQLFFGEQSQSILAQSQLMPKVLQLRYNLWDVYQAALKGQALDLRPQASVFHYRSPLDYG